MDLAWTGQPSIIVGLICLLLPSQISPAHAWSLPARDSAVSAPVGRHLNEVSPYVDLALCPIRAEPWTCARQQSARILDAWDGELHVQWQKLKVEADRQMNATIERRGYSTSELPVKEKPSTILKKIEIGTNYMKKYLAESMDGFFGREYEYLQTPKAADDESETDDADEDDETDAGEDTADDTDTSDAAEETADEEDDDDDEDENDDASDSTAEQDQDQEQDHELEPENDDEDVDEAASEAEKETEKDTAPSIFSGQPAASAGAAQDDGKSPVFSEANSSSGVEFIELQDGDETAAGALKKPGGGGSGKRKKNKRKKGGKRKKNKKGHGQGQDTQQPATLVVVQAAPEHHEVDHGHGSDSTIFSHGSSHGGASDDDDDTEAVGKPMKKRKQKRRMKGKRKRKGQHGSGGSNSVVEHEQSDLSLGLGLLDELVDGADYASGGKRKHRNPLNYGRSNGVTRGKKKKKKKALAKFVLIGSFLKAKIELLLKILGAHLQVKFFAIALIGLLINIARFWIDVKRGSPPSKVVYVEHAHHQHHYEDHGDDWSEPGGSYWKRSLQTDPSIEDTDSSTDSYQLRQAQPQQQSLQDPHYLAYRNQYQWQ